LNVSEFIINLITLIISIRKTAEFQAIGFGSALMMNSFTFKKTVLYSLYGHSFPRHNEFGKYILLYTIPNGVWLVIPLVSILLLVR